jgi:hypothetical protein
VGVLHCGPRAVLASFSAAESLGLGDWAQAEVHVLAPAGVRRPRVPGLTVVLHRTRGEVDPLGARPVQQRLTSADALRAAIAAAPRIRHRAALMAAVEDIAMGAHALSEIDFARLRRRHGLPEPVRQQVRRDPSGRRRYLDALWVLPDGRRVVVEVDGALHIQVLRRSASRRDRDTSRTPWHTTAITIAGTWVRASVDDVGQVDVMFGHQGRDVVGGSTAAPAPPPAPAPVGPGGHADQRRQGDHRHDEAHAVTMTLARRYVHRARVGVSAVLASGCGHTTGTGAMSPAPRPAPVPLPAQRSSDELSFVGQPGIASAPGPATVCRLTAAGTMSRAALRKG